MEKRISSLGFKFMAYIGIPIRDLFMSPPKMFSEIKIEPGFRILDFGCGPGTFSILSAEKTGSLGKVYALDIHPLALKMVEKKAIKNNLKNIKTILSDCDTSLPDQSIDAVIFFDVFHILENKDDVLIELKRVLKPDGMFYFSDHHMEEEQILSGLTQNGLFVFKEKGKLTFCFRKN